MVDRRIFRTLISKLTRAIVDALEYANVIEASRLHATVKLAWPRIVTGFAFRSKQTVDLAMVGLAVGPAAIAGLAFAYIYWNLGDRISVGFSGGTISLVSQFYGADDIDRANQAILQSFLVATVIGLALSALLHFNAAFFVELIGGGARAVEHGSVYLVIIAPSILFEFYNKIASRAFAAIGDTFTPMLIRGGGAITNIAINAFLIFGLDMGVAGAAIGTVISTMLVTVALVWGLRGNRYPTRGPLPVRLTVSGPLVDVDILRSLSNVGVPIVFQQLSRGFVLFPLLAIISLFGTNTVAAYEIARRVRNLIQSLGWGFSISSSSLVGQHLGKGDEHVATAYGTEIIRLSLVTYVTIAAMVILFSDQIARFFVTDPEVLALASVFIQVIAVATVGLGIEGSAAGALNGAGDTRWPFYGALFGLYAVTLPVAYLGVATWLGIYAILLALLAETFVSATVSLYRYYSKTWLHVSRSIREPEKTV